MATTDDRSQDVMKELTNKLAVSAHQLSEAARRLQLAELTYREYLSRLRKLDRQMRNLVGLLDGTSDQKRRAAPTNPTFCEPPPPKRRKLRYADYIEFSNYAELKKFEKLGGITQKDVEGCDPDDLMRKLLDTEAR